MTSTSKLTKAGDFLREAMACLVERGVTYDKKEGERSMGKVVAIYRILNPGGVIDSEEDGYLFMAILKLVRSQQGEYKADNYTDGAAYFALAGEAAHKERIVVHDY